MGRRGLQITLVHGLPVGVYYLVCTLPETSPWLTNDTHCGCVALICHSYSLSVQAYSLNSRRERKDGPCLLLSHQPAELEGSEQWRGDPYIPSQDRRAIYDHSRGTALLIPYHSKEGGVRVDLCCVLTLPFMCGSCVLFVPLGLVVVYAACQIRP